MHGHLDPLQQLSNDFTSIRLLRNNTERVFHFSFVVGSSRSNKNSYWGGSLQGCREREHSLILGRAGYLVPDTENKKKMNALITKAPAPLLSQAADSTCISQLLCAGPKPSVFQKQPAPSPFSHSPTHLLGDRSRNIIHRGPE